MKKFLSMLLCVAMVLSLCAVTFAAGETATLVTDASTLKAGDKIVILNQDGTKAMGAQGSNKFRSEVTASVTGKKVVVTTDMAVVTLETGATAGTFALKTTEGYLYYSSGNYVLSKEMTVDNTASWTIDITDEVATIRNTGDAERMLQYNSSATRFSCYKASSNQENPAIYKLEAGQANPDQVAAAAVIGKINAIGTPVTTASKTAIEAARAAYTALTDTQKDLVTNLETLTAAETKLAELLSAAKPFANGDKVVIYAPAYNKALSSTAAATYYQAGVDVTVTDGNMTGYGETELWIAVINSDGTVSFQQNGKNLGMADANSSMSLGAVNDKWELIYLGEGLYLLKNVVRGNYMEWYASKGNWSTYNSTSAANDKQFRLSFYVAPTLTPDQEKANAVINKINTIGTVTSASKTVIEEARAAYDALTDTQKDLVTNLETLTAAETKLAELLSAAKPFANGDKVVIYAPAYNKALSSTAAATYYQAGVDVTLTDGVLAGFGETEIWTVVIHEDGTVSFQQGDKNIGLADENSSMSLGAANDKWELIYLGDGLYLLKNVVRGNYMEWYDSKGNWSTYNSKNAATDDQFQLAFYVVPQVDPNEEAAKAVDALIEAIGEVTLEKENAITAARAAYDELSDEAKDMVTKLETLTAAETELAAQKKAAADKAAADAVVAQINAIGEVTPESKAAIDAARAAYEALTADQKDLVSKLDTLTAAETRLQELKDAAAQAAADKAAADDAAALIEKIGTVTKDSKAAIDAARAAYDALTDAQKALVENYETLTKAEEAYKGIANTGDSTMLFVAMAILSMTAMVVVVYQKKRF